METVFFHCAVSVILATQTAYAQFVDLPPVITNSSGEYWIDSLSNISYAQQSITCSSVPCHVTCETQQGCQLTRINASASSELILTCLQYESCEFTNIFPGPTDYVQINCLYKFACTALYASILHTSSVQIMCNSSSQQQLACDQAIFQAPEASNVYVYCGENDCFTANRLNVNHTNSTHINGHGAPPLIYAQHIRSKLEITSSDISGADIYCPQHAEYGCILNADGHFSLTGSNVYCGRNASCIINAGNLSAGDANIHCADNVACTFNIMGSASFAESTIHCAANLECNLSSTDYPQTFKQATIYCPNDEPCNVQCTSSHSCYQATFHCPGEAGNACNIECTGDNSCALATIHCRAGSECAINCQGANACFYQTIYLPSANYSGLNLTCNRQDGVCDESTFECVNTSLTSRYLWYPKQREYACDSADCCPVLYQQHATKKTVPLWLLVVIGCVSACLVLVVVCLVVRRRRELKRKQTDSKDELLINKE